MVSGTGGVAEGNLADGSHEVGGQARRHREVVRRLNAQRIIMAGGWPNHTRAYRSPDHCR